MALGNEEFRGNEQCHAFRLSLIRDPRFTGAVNDIVVEFGNARYQDLMDRFVEGEEVPYESLRQVWLNTTQPVQEWAFPIYEEFFRAVATNAKLTVHIGTRYGTNAHHLIEACFKAFARALREAVAIDPGEAGVPSTKGTLS